MFVREMRTGTSYGTYLVGARGPEYRRDDTQGANGPVRWYVYDGLGSVLAEVDPNGNITSSRKYDAYGFVRGGINPTGTSSHKFVGQLGHPSEDNTGYIYMRARYMDPNTGRFVSEDTDRQGLNWYVYCANNPINSVDQSGKFILFLAVFLVAFAVSTLTTYLSGQSLEKSLICGLLSGIAALAACVSPGVGLLAGAIIGGATSKITGGSVNDIIISAIFGGAFGAIGGFQEGFSPSGLTSALNEISGREMLAYFLLSFDEGMISGDMGILSAGF